MYTEALGTGGAREPRWGKAGVRGYLHVQASSAVWARLRGLQRRATTDPEHGIPTSPPISPQTCHGRSVPPPPFPLCSQGDVEAQRG